MKNLRSHSEGNGGNWKNKNKNRPWHSTESKGFSRDSWKQKCGINLIPPHRQLEYNNPSSFYNSYQRARNNFRRDIYYRRDFNGGGAFPHLINQGCGPYHDTDNNASSDFRILSHSMNQHFSSHSNFVNDDRMNQKSGPYQYGDNKVTSKCGLQLMKQDHNETVRRQGIYDSVFQQRSQDLYHGNDLFRMPPRDGEDVKNVSRLNSHQGEKSNQNLMFDVQSPTQEGYWAGQSDSLQYLAEWDDVQYSSHSYGSTTYGKNISGKYFPTSAKQQSRDRNYNYTEIYDDHRYELQSFNGSLNYTTNEKKNSSEARNENSEIFMAKVPHKTQRDLKNLKMSTGTGSQGIYKNPKARPEIVSTLCENQKKIEQPSKMAIEKFTLKSSISVPTVCQENVVYEEVVSPEVNATEHTRELTQKENKSVASCKINDADQTKEDNFQNEAGISAVDGNNSDFSQAKKTQEADNSVQPEATNKDCSVTKYVSCETELTPRVVQLTMKLEENEFESETTVSVSSEEIGDSVDNALLSNASRTGKGELENREEILSAEEWLAKNQHININMTKEYVFSLLSILEANIIERDAKQIKDLKSDNTNANVNSLAKLDHASNINNSALPTLHSFNQGNFSSCEEIDTDLGSVHSIIETHSRDFDSYIKPLSAFKGAGTTVNLNVSKPVSVKEQYHSDLQNKKPLNTCKIQQSSTSSDINVTVGLQETVNVSHAAMKQPSSEVNKSKRRKITEWKLDVCKTCKKLIRPQRFLASD